MADHSRPRARAPARHTHKAASNRFGRGDHHRDHQALAVLGRLRVLPERPQDAQELPARRAGVRPRRAEPLRSLPAGGLAADGALADGARHRQDRAHRARGHLDRLSRELPGLVHERALPRAQRRRRGRRGGEPHAQALRCRPRGSLRHNGLRSGRLAAQGRGRASRAVPRVLSVKGRRRARAKKGGAPGRHRRRARGMPRLLQRRR